MCEQGKGKEAAVELQQIIHQLTLQIAQIRFTHEANFHLAF